MLRFSVSVGVVVWWALPLLCSVIGEAKKRYPSCERPRGLRKRHIFVDGIDFVSRSVSWSLVWTAAKRLLLMPFLLFLDSFAWSSFLVLTLVVLFYSKRVAVILFSWPEREGDLMAPRSDIGKSRVGQIVEG